jgi:hypothetical protein
MSVTQKELKRSNIGIHPGGALVHKLLRQVNRSGWRIRVGRLSYVSQMQGTRFSVSGCVVVRTRNLPRLLAQISAPQGLTNARRNF